MTEDLWIWVLGGFRQWRSNNGSINMWQRLEKRYAQPGHVFVQYLSWHDSASAAAEQAWWMRPDYDVRKVKNVICGFSWGGALAVKLAREFKRRGILIDHMVLCDAVYRHSYWAGQWRAYAPWSKLVIPTNVKKVSWAYQDQTLLRGHKVVAECDTATRVLEGTKLHADHIYMDDEPWYFETACSAINDILKPQEPCDEAFVD